ncbi:hypothetical protein IAQ61_008490 [Plenodomus lingam]|uniref:uncharacterized protein n=1 Tax=Leptosphaeria maculans TaxID=5022 RepID=UPI003320B4F3|nr:hypothetical protein IAQ61_008490 [Plenodomus lingam]
MLKRTGPWKLDLFKAWHQRKLVSTHVPAGAGDYIYDWFQHNSYNIFRLGLQVTLRRISPHINIDKFITDTTILSQSVLSRH